MLKNTDNTVSYRAKRPGALSIPAKKGDPKASSRSPRNALELPKPLHKPTGIPASPYVVKTSTTPTTPRIAAVDRKRRFSLGTIEEVSVAVNKGKLEVEEEDPMRLSPPKYSPILAPSSPRRSSPRTFRCSPGMYAERCSHQTSNFSWMNVLLGAMLGVTVSAALLLGFEAAIPSMMVFLKGIGIIWEIPGAVTAAVIGGAVLGGGIGYVLESLTSEVEDDNSEWNCFTLT